jgi:hypothetical protein
MRTVASMVLNVWMREWFILTVEMIFLDHSFQVRKWRVDKYRFNVSPLALLYFFRTGDDVLRVMYNALNSPTLVTSSKQRIVEVGIVD